MAGELTKKFEGWRPYIYDDKTGKPATGKPKGKRTVGYGFNIDDPAIASLLPKDVISGKRLLTEKEAAPLFDKLYLRAKTDAIKFVGEDTFQKLNPTVQETLTDISYNLGYNKLSGFQKFKKALLANNMSKAAEELKNSKWFNQVGDRSKYHYDIIKNTKPLSSPSLWDKILKTVKI